MQQKYQFIPFALNFTVLTYSGLLHVRSRVWTPVLQFREHLDHWLQSPQRPSTLGGGALMATVVFFTEASASVFAVHFPDKHHLEQMKKL